MRASLDLNAVQINGEPVVILLETRNELKIFDSLFNKFSRYGTSEPKPTVDSRLKLQLKIYIQLGVDYLKTQSISK